MSTQEKTFKINFYKMGLDKKAPRFRMSKYRHNVVNEEMFDRFLKETGKKVSYKQFKEIVRTISETIIDNVLIERNGVALPEQMGKNWLGLFKHIRKDPDREDVIQSYYPCLETGGLLGKIVWDFRGLKYKVKNREMYMFLPHRNFKTKASKSFISNSERYVRIVGISRELEKMKIKEQIKNEQQDNTTITE